MTDYTFTTDGCSGGMTYFWQLIFNTVPPWNDACVEHDKLYWQGGSKEDRRSADAALMDAVTANGHPIFAILMWMAVRIGGHPLLPFSWRWNYGWKYPKGYYYDDRLSQ